VYFGITNDPDYKVLQDSDIISLYKKYVNNYFQSYINGLANFNNTFNFPSSALDMTAPNSSNNSTISTIILESIFNDKPTIKNDPIYTNAVRKSLNQSINQGLKPKKKTVNPPANPANPAPPSNPTAPAYNVGKGVVDHIRKNIPDKLTADLLNDFFVSKDPNFTKIPSTNKTVGFEPIFKAMKFQELVQFINDLINFANQKVAVDANYLSKNNEKGLKGLKDYIDNIKQDELDDIAVQGLGMKKPKKVNLNHHIVNDKYYVDKNLLDNYNLYELRYLKNKHLKNKPITLTNKQMQDMVKKIIYSKEYEQNELNTLPKEDQYVIYKIMKDMDLEIPVDNKFNQEFNMLMGQIKSGNSNDIVKQKMKRALSIAYDLGKLNMNQINKIKLDLDL